MAHTADAWVGRFAEALGVPPPSPEELNDLLALAGIAAHSSERQAAPISCWLVARAGVSPADAKQRAGVLAEELDASG